MSWTPVALLAILLLGGAESAEARQLPVRPATTTAESQDPLFTMELGARIQVRYTHDDTEGTDALRIRRARLSLGGQAYRHFDYALQVGLAGSNAELLDANVRYAASPLATLWFGQGKAFFGRQQLTSSGNLNFVDRSIVDGRFAAGRQQGIAVVGRLAGDRLEYNAGVYNGNGINQSANQNDHFMTVGRVVWTPLGSYAPTESAHDYPESPRLALGISGLRNTVEEVFEEVEIDRANVEAAFKLRGLNMTAELYREWAGPSAAGEWVTDGWYYQAGYLLPGLRHEIAGRYAVISPDAAADSDTIETGIGYSYYFNAHRAKVQADFRNIHLQASDTDERELRVQFQLSL